ncbi:unnamed protein product [Caenorhabditis angaria]|uniref:Ig-like domain-containing protein n=1 Tax=Caenorhabditis angaria TaxID=860376 RepID=A0A9P1IGZ7_9PELO|nr:unnamed protein product [Caenorhabditis angaria]
MMFLKTIIIVIFIGFCVKEGFCVSQEVMDCLRQERSTVENPSQRIAQVIVENPAYLHCSVPSDAEHEIAWIRLNDGALLTAGNKSFTTDPRFQISRKNTNDWVLNLRRSEYSDTGCYLCNINDKDNTVYAIYLTVMEPPLPSPSALHKKATDLMANWEGDSVILNCTVTAVDDKNIPSSNSNSDPEDDVIWTRDGKRMNLNDTDKYNLKVKRDASIIVETVRIKKATREDNGEYACSHQKQQASHRINIDRSSSKLQITIAIFSSLSLAFLI